MPHYVVSIPGHRRRSVEAPNMLLALGRVVDEVGGDVTLDRLVCDITPAGVLMARRAGTEIVYRVEPEEVSSEAGTDMFSIPVDLDDMLDDDTHEEDHAFDALDLSVEIEPLSGLLDEPVEVLETLDGPADVFRSVADLMNEVRNAPSVTDGWHRALTLAHELIACEAGSGLRADPDRFLRFAIATGPQARQVANLQIPASSGIAGFCIERAVGVVISDPVGDPRFYRAVDRISGFKTQAMVCAPVVHNRTALGCLQLLNPPPGRQFSDVDLDLLSQVAEALADRLVRG